jgi:hypothetical protein
MFADQVLKALSQNPHLGQPVGNNTPHLLPMMKKAQFFDFGLISRSAQDVEYEPCRELFEEGFLWPPAPVSFFTYQVGIDITNFEGSIHTQPISSGKDLTHFGLLVDMTNPDRIPVIPITSLCLSQNERMFLDFRIQIPPDRNLSGGDFLQYTYPEHLDSYGPPSLAAQNVISVSGLMILLLGRLDADGMAREVVYPPEKVNAKRRKRGKPEMVKYTVVKVRPHRAAMGHSGPLEGDEYTPKCYHFRRGHIRRFKNGQKTRVRHCFVGTPEDGRVEHRYVVEQ